MRSFAHIVNPVRVGPERDLYVAQPLTFESMRRAQHRAAEARLPVTLLTAQLAADRPTPDGFVATPDLTRTVLDLGAFEAPRPLPLIGDILARAFAASDAEIFVYTNVDIAVTASFYVAIDAELTAGADALTINRRTVRARAGQAPTLDWLLAEPGEPHDGYDCFVFARALLENLDLHGVCIGFPPIGRILVGALSTRARDFRLLTDRRLTFHLDDGKPWQDGRYQDYWRHNQREGLRVLDGLAARRPLSPLAAQLRRDIAAQERL